MYLKHLIERLEKEPADKVVLGFKHPHSYRGYYEDLAFEPAQNVTVGEMLAAARSAVGSTYEGWKGGDYTMSEWSSVWIAERGTSCNGAPMLLIDMMLAHSPNDRETEAETQEETV